MLVDYYDLPLSGASLHACFGLILGLAFGAVAQISRFCLRRGLVDTDEGGRAALATWIFAFAVALAATSGLQAAGLIKLEGHRFLSGSVPVVSILVGGLLFGAGMVLARGCAARLTVLIGQGNLRALMVMLTFALFALASMRGVLAPVRGALQGVQADVSGLVSWIESSSAWLAPLIASLLVLVAWRLGLRWGSALAALAIGVLVAVAWSGSSVLLYDAFEPQAVQGLALTAPWADSLFWLGAATAIPAGFGPGVIAGLILGALLTSLVRREFKLESFQTPAQSLRYLLGGALMGFGGVLAGGCTIGAGLAGGSLLSPAALLALAAIIAGAVLTNLVLGVTARGHDRAGLGLAPSSL